MRPMLFAYADPPYLGNARRHYRNHPDYAGEVDHAALIARLVTDFPDGWALSCSSPSLRTLLPLCPPDVRVMAWVKPFAIFKKGVNPAYAWEPLIVRGGRRQPLTRRPRRGERLTVRDWVSANVTLQRGVAGAKPEAFCLWVFSVLGAEPDDTFVDLFPGSGAVTDAWQRYASTLIR